MMGISWYQSARFFKDNRITVGFDWFRYGGEAWSEYVSGEDAGTRSDLVDKHENEVAGYVDFRQDVGKWLTFNAGLRVDHHSRVGTEWVPQAGLAFHLPHTIELKASASKGFRYPILREMYMFPPQNPDLTPESMWNYEIAFSQRLLGGSLSYGINLFYIDGKNLIMTLPNPSGSGMLNQNSGEIDNAGVEAQVAYRFNKSWSVDANYSYLHMENPVIAAPEHKLYAGANFTQGRWSVSTGIQYIAGLTPRQIRLQPRILSYGICADNSVPPHGSTSGTRRKPAGTALRNQCRIPDAKSYGDGRYKSELLIDKLQYI